MYQIRMRTFQMGSFILLFYSLLSVGSVWLYNIDSVWTFETITIFPLVYLSTENGGKRHDVLSNR